MQLVFYAICVSYHNLPFCLKYRNILKRKKGGEADVRQQAKRANAGEENRGHNVQSDLRVFKEGHGNGG